VLVVVRIALALLRKRFTTPFALPRTVIFVQMDIHVALQIILAAEALGALTTHVGSLAGFGGHFCCLWEGSLGIFWELGQELGAMFWMRALGYFQCLEKRRITDGQGL
jgi:hypothetical protein